MVTQVIELARKAGSAILDIYSTSFSVEYKKDSSPLTDADRAAHNIICEALPGILDVPVVSEEGEISSSVQHADAFWLVDPLDGTKEFLKRSGDFTVNIALIRKRMPVLGVVFVPAKNLIYYAGDQRAFKINGEQPPQQLRTRKSDPEALCIVASKDHAGPEVERLLERLPKARLASMGSSLKFCLIAEAEADFYPRFGPTMEWDTAAAHAVLAAAGGNVLIADGSPLLYGKDDFRNSAFFGVGDLGMHWKEWLR